MFAASAAAALALAAGAAQAPAPVEVARLGFGSSFGALVTSPDGGAWVHIDRSTETLLDGDGGLWDDAIGRAGADNRFRRVAVDGPLVSEATACGACDDRPRAVRLSPALLESVSLARLRRGVRVSVRESAREAIRVTR